MQSRVHERVAAIEALPEEDRERLRELLHRSDTLNNAVVDLMDGTPSPDARRHQEQLALLTAERDAAHAAYSELEAALGLPEL